MSETKAAFAERTKQSLKNKLYRHMEEFGNKYICKLSQSVTTLKSKKMLARIDTKKIQEFRLSVHSVQQATTRI